MPSVGNFRTKWLVIGAVFVGILALYTVPFPDWRFWGDDYGAFDVAQISSVHDLTDYFGATPNHRIAYPSNTRDTTAWTFASVSFRPLTLMMYAGESWLCGGYQPQLFFLGFMILFAIILMMIFRWLSWGGLSTFAWLGTFFFAGHAALGGWLGVWASQTYLILFIGMSGVLSLLWQFFEQRAWWLVWAAAGLFFVLLLFHEQVAIVPVWLLPVVMFYGAHGAGCWWRNREAFCQAVRLTMPFWIVLLGYFVLRVACYPLCHNSAVAVVKTVPFFARFFDLVTYIVDLFGFGWMPSGIRLVKGTILTATIVYMGWLFYWSQEKSILALLVWSIVCWSWPSILVRHQGRFLIFAVPFLAAYVLRAVLPFMRHQRWYWRVSSWLGIIWLALCSCAGAWHNYLSMKSHYAKAFLTSQALQQLVNNPAVQDKSICFVGIPRDWFPGEGIAQAVWLYRGSRELPVFHEDQLCVYCFKSMDVKESADLPQYPLVDLTISDNVVKLRSLDREHAWFFALDEQSLSWTCNMGMVFRKEPGPKAYEVTVFLDRSWLRDDLAFVTWNFERRQFEPFSMAQKGAS